MNNLKFFVLFFPILLFAQNKSEQPDLEKKIELRPEIKLYKYFNHSNDTLVVDTTLTIQKEYRYNFLRKDNFGLLSFHNEGQVFNVLNFGLIRKGQQPNFGFTAKHINYLEIDDINYFNVPTPLTDLYFKTVMEQGQSLDALIAINVKPNFNFSIANRGLRSLGKYVNALTSIGNFRTSINYNTLNKKYFLKTHFAGQDIKNNENGGIKDLENFNSSIDPFNERERLEVFFNDGFSKLKGNRFYLNHLYHLNSNISIGHEFNGEYKFFEFTQPLSSRFGNSYSNLINKKTRFNTLYNKVIAFYSFNKLGKLGFFIDNSNTNQFYQSIVFDNQGNSIVPSNLNIKITNLGAEYHFQNDKIFTQIKASNSISNQSVSSFEFNSKYAYTEDIKLNLTLQYLSSLPNLNYTFYQSEYTNYNWFNNFNNEKTLSTNFDIISKWLNISLQYKNLKDYLYLKDTSTNSDVILVKPFQNSDAITYFSAKASKEFQYKKWALDNTILYQNVSQNTDIVNVPELVTRNTLYFSTHVFKKAMFLQTGVTLNYFTKYYSNEYNPLLGEFYVQNQTKTGSFPMLDFFVNAKVRQARIYIKAEHFNSSFTGYNYYVTPTNTYRDFMVRFGLEWNMFK